MSLGKREVIAEEVAVANFREYLRIPSVHPDVNYGMIYKKVDVIIFYPQYQDQAVSVTEWGSLYVLLVFRGDVTRSTFRVIAK